MEYNSTSQKALTTTGTPNRKRGLPTTSIVARVCHDLPSRKIVLVSSSLPTKRKQQGKIDAESSPEKVLRSLLSAKGIETDVYAYDQLSNFFFENPSEIDPTGASKKSSYAFDVVNAVREGNVSALRAFHLDGRALYCSNSFGETLLHLACRKALISVVQFLVEEAGVPINVVDRMGRSPLHDAFWAPEPNFGLIDILVSKCPDLLYIKDERGHTPLSYTRGHHWNQWVEYLRSRVDTLAPLELKPLELKNKKTKDAE